MTETQQELRELLAEIEAGPEGPEIGAFFDFDGTLIAGYSAEAWVLDALRRRKIDPQTMATRRIFEHRAMDGFVASTTAIQIGNEMWLGSQRGDRIAYFPAPK